MHYVSGNKKKIDFLFRICFKTYKSFKSLCSMVGFEFENQNTQPNQRALNFNPTDKHSLSSRMSDCKLRCRTMGQNSVFCS